MVVRIVAAVKKKSKLIQVHVSAAALVAAVKMTVSKNRKPNVSLHK